MSVTVVYQNVSELSYGRVVDDLKIEDAATLLQSDYVRIGKTDYGRIYVQFFGDKGFITNLYWVPCGIDGYWTQEIQGYTRFVFPAKEITPMSTATLNQQIDQIVHNLNALRAYQSHWTRDDRQLEAKYINQLMTLEAQLNTTLESEFLGLIPEEEITLTPVIMETTFMENGYALCALLSKPNGITLWSYQYNTRSDISIDMMADTREQFVRDNHLEIVWDNLPEEEEIERHITLEEGIAWLTRSGYKDVRALGQYLISAVYYDGYSVTTDIREHSISSIAPVLERGQSDYIRDQLYLKGYTNCPDQAIIAWRNGINGFAWYVTLPTLYDHMLCWQDGQFTHVANLDQVPYVANGDMSVAQPEEEIKLELTPLQQTLLSEQIEYWRNRFDDSWARANADDCEFCAAYIVAIEAIFGAA